MRIKTGDWIEDEDGDIGYVIDYNSIEHLAWISYCGVNGYTWENEIPTNTGYIKTNCPSSVQISNALFREVLRRWPDFSKDIKNWIYDAKENTFTIDGQMIFKEGKWFKPNPRIMIWPLQ